MAIQGHRQERGGEQMKRYWLQTVYGSGMVILKTKSVQRAINRLNKTKEPAFIWDCLNRVCVRANYEVRIV